MIKAIFFDFDGVLTTFKSGSANTCYNLSLTYKDIPFEKIVDSYKPFRSDLIIGKVTHAEIWPEFCKSLGREIPYSALEKAFRDTPKNNEMLKLVKQLKKNYKLGIITDNNNERFDLLSKLWKLPELFDTFVVSGDIGSTKREQEIFDLALSRFSITPQETVFIDNLQKNLVVPAQMGIKTYFFDDEKPNIPKLKKALTSFGVFV